MGEEPYREFYCAIISQALTDLKIKKELQAKGEDWKKALVTDPEYYVFVSKSGYPTSFTRICDLLNFNPEKIRQGIKEKIQNELPSLSR